MTETKTKPRNIVVDGIQLLVASREGTIDAEVVAVNESVDPAELENALMHLKKAVDSKEQHLNMQEFKDDEIVGGMTLITDVSPTLEELTDQGVIDTIAAVAAELHAHDVGYSTGKTWVEARQSVLSGVTKDDLGIALERANHPIDGPSLDRVYNNLQASEHSK